MAERCSIHLIGTVTSNEQKRAWRSRLIVGVVLLIIILLTTHTFLLWLAGRLDVRSMALLCVPLPSFQSAVTQLRFRELCYYGQNVVSYD